MLCAILALALTAQFSQEPLVGDTVAITGGTGCWSPVAGMVEGWSQPNLCDAQCDAKVACGQLAKVARKFSTRRYEGEAFGTWMATYVVLQLPDRKSFTIFSSSVTKITDIDQKKKIFVELSGANADVVKKAATRRTYAKIMMKHKQTIAKKYQLNLQAIDFIESVGRTNGW